MWVGSRPAATFKGSQNAAVLRADGVRLRAWLLWLRAVARWAGSARRAAPVAGRWTLRFTVHVDHPAWQKVVVEQRGDDGVWREIHGRVLIEFRAYAARPQTRGLRLEFGCPVADGARSLRIVSRCVGRVGISHVELTDGVTVREMRPVRARHELGEAAAKAGWPVVDWVTNTGVLELVWS